MIYIILMNLYSIYLTIPFGPRLTQEQEVFTGNTASMGDTVTIGVKRNKILGIKIPGYRILEHNGEANLYLLGIIKLPLFTGGKNLKNYHLTFLIILIGYVITIFSLKFVKGGDKDGKRMEEILESNANYIH